MTTDRRGWVSPITPEQCRAARALLGWSQEQLAENADVHHATISDFEKGKRSISATTQAAIVAALTGAGVILLQSDGTPEGGIGVRLRNS
jgi:transcriptional regulator with XRE-family HTH domain